VTRHSPCVGICKLDDATGYCIGCGRTGNEVASWISLTEDERDDVWLKLPPRLASLSVGVRLLPWRRGELADWVSDSIVHRRGTWVTGAPGAAAEFPCTGEREIAVAASDDTVVARAPDASFRLRLTDKVRAFAFAGDGPIVLGLPKARATLPSSSVVAALGSDADAIDVSHRGDRLFDFGVGRKASRFCVRTGDDALATTLAANTGRHWSEVMPAIGKEILSVSPNRVVETAAARIEVFAPIPPPDGEPPAGAHTHFLPAFLQSGEEISAGLALPDFAAPVAIFYPADTPRRA
jgi:predicted Fe-S protein YdhL (DUF1289 family)